MPRPTMREMRAVARVLDSDMSDDAMDMAREAIEALDEVRVTKDQWIVVARVMAGGPYLAVGPWTTKKQAMKASESLCSAHKEPTPGTGMIVMPMNQPAWLDKLK